MELWEFVQEQVLGMQWLNALIGRGPIILGRATGYNPVFYDGCHHFKLAFYDYAS